MRVDETSRTTSLARRHAVDVAFGLLAAGWLAYILRITSEFSFWSDDLYLVEQAGSIGGLFEPYNDHLSVVILLIFRVAAEMASMSYTPFMVAGSLSLLAVPVTYFLTTRRRLTPEVAAVVATSLLWYDGMSLRPALLNHYLALVGGILCAGALHRGRRADVPLALALLFSLCSAGGGLAVASACVVHSLLTRARRRRWVAVLVPVAAWVLWWVLVAGDSTLTSAYPLSFGDGVAVVRDLLLSPFYALALGFRPLAYVLMGGFVAYGAWQIRQGLAAAATYVAWVTAMVVWAIALVRSRGALANPDFFRYAYLSTGFACLAVIPHRPLQWPSAVPVRRTWLAAAMAALILVFGGARAVVVRDGLQDIARGNSERGREATGTLLVLQLGPEAIPDDTPLSFFGLFTAEGTAAQVRLMLDRYGAPATASADSIDRELVDRGIARSRPAGVRDRAGCEPLSAPFLDPGSPDHGPGPLGVSSGRAPIRLWAASAVTVEVRRFGEAWAPLAEAPAGRDLILTLPALNSERRWEIRADGACLIAD